MSIILFYAPRVTSNTSIDVTDDRPYALHMARSAFTLRLPSDERVALENLSKVEGRPMNQLLNEAIKSYLSRRGQKRTEP